MIAIPILLSLSMLIVDIVINRKIYSPGVIFNGITFITLFLYCFQLSYIQQTLSWKTVLLLTMCIMWFNIPVFIGYTWNYKRVIVIESENNKQKDITLIELKNNEPSKRLDLILFIVILLLFVIEIIYNQGVPLIWKLTGSNKNYMDFGMPVVHQFFVALFVLVGAYSLFKRKCYYKWFYLAIPVLIISRAFLLAIFIEGFVVYLITARKKPKYFWVYLSVAVILGVILFGLFGNFRTGENEFLAVAKFKSGTKWMPTSFKWLYSYMCFSLSNLNNLISMTSGFVNYGASSFNDLFHMFFVIPENQSYDFLVSRNFTVSTFVPTLYLDFGILGPILFCMIIGLLNVLIYKKVEDNTNNQVGYVLLYAFFAYATMSLYFANLFFNSIVLQIILIPIIFYLPQLIKRKKNL